MRTRNAENESREGARSSRPKNRSVGPSKRVLAVLGAAGLLTAAASVFAVSTAYANSAYCNPDGSACAEFRSYGEKLIVHDEMADGVGAVAFIYDNGVYYGYCLNNKGYDAPPVTCDYSFPEGSKVQYKVCNWDGDDFNCSEYRQDVA
jgi:hypothetical protein